MNSKSRMIDLAPGDAFILGERCVYRVGPDGYLYKTLEMTEQEIYCVCVKSNNEEFHFYASGYGLVWRYNGNAKVNLISSNVKL